MKKSIIVIILLSLTIVSVSQPHEETHNKLNNNELTNRKTKGYYGNMQISLLMGNNYPDNNYYPCKPRNPSFTISNGYMFNSNWLAGVGIGFEIFDHNLFPLFAEIRYTFWDEKISPFFTLKGGYSFGNFKARHYDELHLNWEPNWVNDANLRHYGGILFNPEIGVKIPLNDNSDLLFSAAYRHQKTRSIVKKENHESNEFDEWEHKEDRNLIAFSIAIMFR
jgi:hypothetical protein